ncbi:MAG: energy transducer TonB [Methylococcaceae bacterium]|nr:energy transducer TonB [Methylococcaceae bacterium]
MTRQAVFDPPSNVSDNDALLISLVAAALVHIVLVMGMNFSKPEPEKFSRAIDITLVNTPARNIPQKAKFLAQENQIGAGEKAKMPEPPAQKLPSQGSTQKKTIDKTSDEVSKPKAKQQVVTQHTAEKKVSTTKAPDPASNTETKPHISAESLQQQVAQLGAEIRLSHPSADETKIKFVDSVSAHKYMAAQYMKDWESKVERTGNLNYPEVAAKKNFSATLTMDVGIKADGSIYSIRINKSSGNPALDEAAQKIVRMSSPFAPLPSELLKELDVLVITRVWKFSDESGLVTK